MEKRRVDRASPTVPDAELPLVLRQITEGEPATDADFDSLYPRGVQKSSRVHWTPVAVARRAVRLLVNRPGLRVLDVGAGPGKFCLIGALCSEARFTGIEQRGPLVALAREIAERYAIPRVRFEQGNITEIKWEKFDAFYLYNPYCENFYQNVRIDDSIPLSRSLYRYYVHFTEDALSRARKLSRLVLYHGFGGHIPQGWELESREIAGSGKLELWIKR
jgi:SAM-dependent methyltransferase